MSSDETEEEEDIAVGIDLGTTNSCVAVADAYDVTVIEDRSGKRKTPSVVHFLPGGEETVGTVAKNQRPLAPKSVVSNSKRFLGRKYCEIAEGDKCGLDIVNQGGTVAIRTDENVCLSPRKVAETILKYLKQCAETRMDTTINKAVITVPARFNCVQRDATFHAAKSAGFEEVFLLNEPTAAALAFGHGMEDTDQKNVVVYDFGGGTFDVSVVRIAGRNFSVLSTCGDSNLGGTDIDRLLADFCLQEWKKSHPDLVLCPEEYQRLLHLCEEAKEGLSSNRTKHIDLRVTNLSDPLGMDFRQEDLRQLAEKLFSRTIELMNQAIDRAGLVRDQVDHVVVVGGSSRIPRVRALLGNYFKPSQLSFGLNEDEAVVRGAAMFAYHWKTKPEIRDFVIEERVTASLGLKSHNGKMFVMIPEGAKLPQTRELQVTTIRDEQRTVEFMVFEGGHEEAEENRFLGKVVLSNLRPTQAGRLKLRVRFDFNKNSMLIVSAYDEENQEIQQVVFQNYAEIDMRDASLTDTEDPGNVLTIPTE